MSSEPIPEPPNLEAGDAQAQIDRLSRAFEDIKKSLEQFKRIAQPDPAMALVRARRVLEYVVRDLFRRHVPEKAGTRPLDNLVTRLVQEGVLDLHIKAYVDHIRELGNAATHGDLSKDFSEADAYRALDALLVVLDWYFKKEQIGDIDLLRREVNVDEATVLAYRGRVRQADTNRQTAQHWRRYGGLAAVSLLAVALGVLHRVVGIGPPWPPPAATAVASWLVMVMAWFASDVGVERDVLPRRAPRRLLIVTASCLTSFLIMLAFFTIPAPDWPNLETRGLWLQAAIARNLDQTPGRTVEDEFQGVGYNPMAIWVPWTVALVRSIMLLSWLATMAGLAALADRLWWLIQESRYDPTLPA
ncbi:MAG TPA: DUF4145 domain-containing protein [Pirellulales bacterium]|nr:DUF4145 domain-containing protein [Pirellulales bacterium]